MSRRLWTVVLAALLLAAPVRTLRGQEPAERTFDAAITAEMVREPLEYLAGDACRGRAAGSEEMHKAARYVAERLKEMGLKPGAPDGTFLQTFEHGRRDVNRTRTALTLTGKTQGNAWQRKLVLDATFVPFRFSAQGSVDAELVFAGYGISSPEHGYDDYADLDVKGKAVLIMRYEPGEKDAQSPFGGAEHTTHATFEAKVANAEKHGAVALVMFTGDHYHEAAGNDLYAHHAAARRESVDIPVLQVTRPEAVRLFKSCGKDAAEVQREIDRTTRPASFPIDGVRVQAEVAFDRQPIRLQNVVAVLPGADEKLSEETVVVGAHLDHIGARSADPDKPDRDTIFNGADDNASGVAALLAIARAMTRENLRPKRTIVFCAFDGEEIGLLGSRHYVNHPVRPLEKTAVMINLDMVGRLRDNALMIMGVGSGKGLSEVANAAAKGLDLKLYCSPSAMAPADSMHFAMSRVPALFFHTGLHLDYHRVTDEASKIDYGGLARVARVAARTAAAIADADAAPEYVMVGPSWRRRADGPVMGVAVVPDDQGRLTVNRVSPGSGADKAGLRAGDLLKSIDGRSPASMQELAQLIGKHRVGDRLTIVAERDGKQRTVEVILGSRKGTSG